MFSGEVISVDRVCSFCECVFFPHYINVSVLLEVPDDGSNKLMCNLMPQSYLLLHGQN